MESIATKAVELGGKWIEWTTGSTVLAQKMVGDALLIVSSYFGKVGDAVKK